MIAGTIDAIDNQATKRVLRNAGLRAGVLFWRRKARERFSPFATLLAKTFGVRHSRLAQTPRVSVQAG
jgi:hypothetical protein